MPLFYIIQKKAVCVTRMGYICIFISVFFNALKGYCSKQIGNRIRSLMDAVNFNILRNAICCVIALAAVIFKNGIIFSFVPAELAIYIVSGISMAVFVVCWTVAVKSDAYMLVSACSSASFTVPCLFGFLLLHEYMTVFKAAAFFLILISLYFLLRYNISLNKKIDGRQLFVLFLILLSQGINQTTQKLFAFYIVGKDVSYYTLFSFIFTVIALAAVKPFLKKPASAAEVLPMKGNLRYIGIMAFGLFGTSYFQSLAAKRVEAILLYPMVSALSLVAGSVMASVFFKEKMRKDCVIGIFVLFAALMLSRL